MTLKIMDTNTVRESDACKVPRLPRVTDLPLQESHTNTLKPIFTAIIFHILVNDITVVLQGSAGCSVAVLMYNVDN